MEYIKFNIKGELAFFKDPYINKKVQCSYPHIHKSIILGILGSILGLDGRNNNSMEYHHKLGSMGIAILPSRLKFPTYEDNTTNTIFGNTDGYAQMIRRIMLVDPEWCVYLKQNKVDDGLWEELKYRLINENYCHNIYLGANDLWAEITDVKIGEMELANHEDIDMIDSIVYRSDINDKIETRRIIFTAPIDLFLNKANNKWEYVNKKLLFSKQEIEQINENVDIYDTGEHFVRFIENCD